MSYDNLCKYLAEQYPREFVRWLLSSEEVNDVQVLKTELSIEPIRADAVIFLLVGSYILHIEFQTSPDSEPPIPLRMLDYWVRLYRLYRRPIVQVVIFLKATSSEAAYTSRFEADNTNHQYRVIRLWEQDPAIFLANPALLPLATLAKTDSPRALLEQVAQRVAKIEETSEQRNVSTCVQLIAGLRFDKDLIRQLFQKDFMRESVIYQEIRSEGIQLGVQQGLQQGLQRGEVALIMRLITRRIGTPTPELQARIRGLSIAELEDLGEALFDFSAASDIVAWLESHQK